MRKEQLLYVGITGNLQRRLRSHERTKNWWSEVVRIEIDRYPNRRSALNDEFLSIHFLGPTYNIQHWNDYDPRLDPKMLPLLVETLNDDVFMAMFGHPKP